MTTASPRTHKSRPMPNYNAGRLGAAVLVLATITGCGGLPATVDGVVTIKGESYAGLRVSFIPEAGGATATCTTDEDGEFTVRTGQKFGLVPGDYRITVKGFSKPPSPMMTKAEVDALRVVPEVHSSRQQTPHRAVIEPGSNRVEIAI